MQLGKRKTIGGRKLTKFANILVVDKEDRRNRPTEWDTKPKSNDHVPSGTIDLAQTLTDVPHSCFVEEDNLNEKLSLSNVQVL